MLKDLEFLEKRYQELEVALADPKVISDKQQYQKLAKELADISKVVLRFREYKNIDTQIRELQIIFKEKHDADFLNLAKSELSQLEKRQQDLKLQIEALLSEEDKEAHRDVLIEIRAGTGGQEASLFVGDLYRMYTKYALRANWTIEPMTSHPTELGGFKEIVFSVTGKDAYKKLKFESGVHRVQRVPQTEASGRIHTSTATVAVLVEPEEVDLDIEPKDLRIDVFRSSGPGGQSVNTADSAVRITHIPSGLVVTCQDERSQLKNKNKAIRVLRARLLEMKRQEEEAKVSKERKSQIGTAQRSEKIRTYNFPDRRVTDHRIGLTLHKLDQIIEGDLDEIFDALIKNIGKG